MKKASEYREHASQCHVLARSTANEAHYKRLEDMAQSWENLALQRERMLKEMAELDRIQALCP